MIILKNNQSTYLSVGIPRVIIAVLFKHPSGQPQWPAGRRVLRIHKSTSDLQSNQNSEVIQVSSWVCKIHWFSYCIF